MATSNRTIYITTFDKERLEELLSIADSFSYRDRDDLRKLSDELKRAQIVDPKAVPPGVVTMNSRIRLSVNDTEMEVTLVFPKDADADKGCISVISPVGTAILGYAVGDAIPCQTPAGLRTLKIDEMLYQPEAEGRFFH